MKLVLYSGGNEKINRNVDLALLSYVKSKRPQITYVPFTFYEHGSYYAQFKKQFAKYGVEDFVYFAPNKKYSAAHFKKAFSSDIIFLSSGNTFTFLNHLREQNLIKAFRRFVKKGGILAGMSAGAIVMTPNITTAVVPSADSDINRVGIKDLKAMNLVGFEFSPHFHKNTSEELRSYSRFTRFPILACDDGAGLIVENNKIQIIGDVTRFKKGKQTQLQSSFLTLDRI